MSGYTSFIREKVSANLQTFREPPFAGGVICLMLSVHNRCMGATVLRVALFGCAGCLLLLMA